MLTRCRWPFPLVLSGISNRCRVDRLGSLAGTIHKANLPRPGESEGTVRTDPVRQISLQLPRNSCSPPERARSAVARHDRKVPPTSPHGKANRPPRGEPDPRDRPNAAGQGDPAPGIPPRESGIGHRASGIGHRASGIGHRASGIGHRVMLR